MNLLGKGADKDFWIAVREKDCFEIHREELHKLWDEKCNSERFLSLSYTDFKRYFVTGDRAIFEGKYFPRRLALDSSALLALIYPEEEKYLNYLMDIAYAMLDEYTWCLPAHQRVLEENNNSRIDLFAAETAFALAEIYALLEDRLDPLIKNRIKAEIERRIIVPYIAKEPYDFWECGNANWTAVCTASVAGALMYIFPELARELIPRFNRSMDAYLDGFKADGICTEGCHYWHYGFGFFLVYADMVKRFTDGEVDYFKNSKVKVVASFIQKMFLSGKSGVSYADGTMNLEYHLGLLHYLKDQYPDAVKVYDPSYSYNYDKCGRFCLHLRSLLWLNEEYYKNPDKVGEPSEYFADITEWFVKTTESYGFSAKGGHNNEDHNHNDVGNFIFAKGGEQIVLDMGGGLYCRKYFSEERYTILETNSFGHNLPIINGEGEKTGAEYRSSNLCRTANGFSLDIAGAYGLTDLKALKRTFSFTDTSVSLNDSFDYSGDGVITERFILSHKPEIDGNKITVGNTVISVLTEGCEFSFDTHTLKNGATVYLFDAKLPLGATGFDMIIA